MNFVNKALNCCDCSMSFVFSAGEQEFFVSKGLVNEPKRCPNCRVLLRLKRAGSEQTATKMACADCGGETLVPFKPSGWKPVYCAVCLRVRRSTEVAEQDLQLMPVS